MRRYLGFLALAVLSSGLLIGGARASVLVHVVQNDPNADNASIVPSPTLPSADFLSSDINFNANTPITFAAFFNNPVFFNVQNGFDATLTVANLFLEITGSTLLNSGANSFVVGHDDGLVLIFADPAIGTVVNTPGATSFVTTPFNVNAPAAGFYAFDLKYSECCGLPANLVFRINDAPVGTTVPEPGSIALFGIGMAGIEAARRRHRRSVRRTLDA